MIALTGVTGALGSRVLRLLETGPEELRLVVRSPASAAGHATDSYRVASDYADTEAMTSALRGCRTLLLVSARESADRLTAHRSAVEAAAAAGVERIIYTSFQGAAPECTFTFGRHHWHTEQAIRQTGARFVFLRDNFYLSGLTGMVGPEGVIRGPAGSGRVAAVSHDDVAAVAARALTDDRWDGQTLDVTGPEPLTLQQAAATMSRGTGKSIRYVPETEEQAYASRADYDAPAFEVTGWVSSYLAIARGEVAAVSDIVPKVTGRPAQDLEAYLAAHPQALAHVRG